MTQEEGDAIIMAGARALAQKAGAVGFIVIATFSDGRLPLVIGNASATVMREVRDFMESRFGVNQ